MKKILSLVLAFALVLSVASVAMAAFSWGPAPESTNPWGYKVEVVKYTRLTGEMGTYTFKADNNATAVNGADVYFAVKLTVPSDVKKAETPYSTTEVKVTFAGLEASNPDVFEIDDLPEDAGVYYLSYDAATPAWSFEPITFFGGQSPVFTARCLDTDTAKVTAKVSSKSEIDESNTDKDFTKGDYDIVVQAGTVTFYEKGSTSNVIAIFDRESNGKVTKVTDGGESNQAVVKLYRWLGTSADALYEAIDKGNMYMSNDNLIANFGYNHKDESVKTWNANTLPIILDPTVSIPKTGDNTSVIGFAMVMIALVGAAVAVKKVKA